jgi:catechol 2,3-dioxygenase-like lactoylglutathione lyase family enzyme
VDTGNRVRVTELLRISTTVADLRRAEAFYVDGLGFIPQHQTRIEDPAWARLMGVATESKVDALTLRLGAQEIELLAFAPPGRPYPPLRSANDGWFQHIALVVEDIEGAWSRLGSRLASRSPIEISTAGPQVLPANTGGVTAVKFRDPEGHPLELLRLPSGVGDPVWQHGRGAEPLGYDHSAITIRDVDRSIAFYTGLLGLRVSGRSLNSGVEQDRLDGLTHTLVDVVALEPADVVTPHLELLCYRRPKGRAPGSEVMANDVASTRQVYRVDRLEELVRRLTEAGVTLVSPGVVDLSGGGHAAAIRDPDGHMIVLTSRPGCQ